MLPFTTALLNTLFAALFQLTPSTLVQEWEELECRWTDQISPQVKEGALEAVIRRDMLVLTDILTTHCSGAHAGRKDTDGSERGSKLHFFSLP